VEFFIKHAPELVSEVKYVPLPAEEYNGVLDRFQKGQAGTAFGGKSEVGVPISELLNRKPKL
jgi:phosphate transport system substrate-binding protein